MERVAWLRTYLTPSLEHGLDSLHEDLGTQELVEE
jgi:hypothetical protein